jgi:hypothetical protein
MSDSDSDNDSGTRRYPPHPKEDTPNNRDVIPYQARQRIGLSGPSGPSTEQRRQLITRDRLPGARGLSQADLDRANQRWNEVERRRLCPSSSSCAILGGKRKRKTRKKRRCSKKRLKKKMICHKGTKKKLKKLRKLTKKLKVKLTKCSKKRLKKWKGGKRCKKTRRKRRGGNNEKAKEYWGKPIKERWRENPLLMVSPNAQRINWVYRTMKDGIPL